MNKTSLKRNRDRPFQNEVGGASMKIVLVHANQKGDDDDSDLQHEDQEELERRERMIRANGPNYCHYILRQQDMMQNHCMGRDGLTMATCNHCGAEGVVDNLICDVCKIGEFGIKK